MVLADLYVLAGDLVDDRRPSGWPHLVSHIGRDLMNRLADHVAGVPLSDPDTRTLRPPEIGQRLREVLDADGETLRDVARGLVDEIAAGSDATAQRAAALVAEAEAGHEPDEGAVEAWVSAWHALQGRFAGWAHLRSPGAREVGHDECESAWRELTDLIATRVAQEPFFESLDELLAIARAPAPASQADARSVLARLRPGAKERFYAELIDPLWVDRLGAQGMFNHPPPAVRQDNTVRFPGWPEGHVLVRFAATAPELVARAARAVPTSDNARVANALAEATAELPAALAADSGLVARVIFDLNGSARLLDIADPAGNADGTVHTMVDGTSTTTYGYDALDRLTSVQDGNLDTVGYGYDLANNETSISYPGTSHTVTRTFDNANNLASVEDWLSNTSTFSYDPDNNLSTTTFPGTTSILGAGRCPSFLRRRHVGVATCGRRGRACSVGAGSACLCPVGLCVIGRLRTTCRPRRRPGGRGWLACGAALLRGGSVQ